MSIRLCRVYTKASLPYVTDHRLLVMNLEFPTTKRKLKHQLSRKTTKEPKPKTDYRMLREDPTARKQLTTKLDTGLASLPGDDMDKQNEQIVETVRESVESVCPKIDPIKKKKPWEDETLKQQLRDLRNCKDHDQSRKLQKTIKKRRQQL